MTALISIIGQGGELSRQVSDALMLLINQGGELGELELREITDLRTGEQRMVKSVPQAWFRRLERAVEVGAFARKTVPEIVHRILTTPEAE